MNKIISVDNEIYILGDFNVNLFLNNSYIFFGGGRISSIASQFQSLKLPWILYLFSIRKINKNRNKGDN